LLTRNVEANGYKNVVLVNKAVAEKTGKVRLYLSGENSGDHRIYDSGDGRGWVEVGSVRVDDYFRRSRVKIDFVKMDVQGAEYAVVRGMKGVLSRNKKVVVASEFWPIGLRRFGVRPGDYLKLLRKEGFRVYEVDRRLKKLERLDRARVLVRYTVENGQHTDLLCRRG
jgi:FkbM family methyltransferase